MHNIVTRHLPCRPWLGALAALLAFAWQLAALPGARAEAGNPLAWRTEKPLALNRDIAMELPPPSISDSPATSCPLTLAWIRFDEKAGKLCARMRVVQCTTMDAKWAVEVECLDASGGRVAGVKAILTTMKIYKTVAMAFEGDLDLDLGSSTLTPRIQRFAVALARVADDTPASTDLIDLTRTWHWPKGDCSLRVRVHRPWRLPEKFFTVRLWRAYDENDPDRPRSALTSEGWQWRDPARRIYWIITGGKELPWHGEVRFTDLPAGEYRVSVAPTGNQRVTPFARSAPMTLGGNVREARTELSLSSESSLTVMVVDPDDGTPLPKTAIRLRDAAGWPIHDPCSTSFLADSNGQVKLDRLAPGEYEVRVGSETGWRLGFEHPERADQWGKRFTVKQGKENICVVPWHLRKPDSQTRP